MQGGWFMDSAALLNGEGGQARLLHHVLPFWIPAFAGMTGGGEWAVSGR